MPKINVEAIKTWVGGPAADHTQVELLLKRKSAAPGATEETVNKTPTVTGANPFNYTWKDVEAKDNKGYDYTYSVEEKGVTDGKITTPSGNTYAVTKNIQNGKHTITNTYEIPKKNVEAVKTWVGGPAADHTPVELLLKRKSTAPGAVEETVNKTPIKSGNGEGPFFYKWENVEVKDNAGYDYTYRVEEKNITSEGTVIIHGRTYKVTQQENAGKHIITNSYDAGTKFIATKT